MRLLVTRPADDARRLVDDLRARGHEVIEAPLLEIEFHEGPPPDLDGVQALLATSANGVRALAHRLAGGPPDLPLLAVGDATARAAQDLGFRDVESAGGDVGALAALVERRLQPENGTLVHVAAGAVAGDLAGALSAAGFTVRRDVLYEARSLEHLPPLAVRALGAGQIDAVLFFSPRTAAAFVRLARAADVADDCDRVTACCLSPAVAEAAAGLNWRDVVVAAEPREAALLQGLEETVVAIPPERDKTGEPDDTRETAAVDAPEETTEGLSDTPFTVSDAAPEDGPVIDAPPAAAPQRGRRRAIRIAWVASLVVAFILGMLVWPSTAPHLLPYLPDFMQDPKELRLASLEARLESLGNRVAATAPADTAPVRQLTGRLETVEKRLAATTEKIDPSLGARLEALEARLGEVAARRASSGDEDRLAALETAVTGLQGKALAAADGGGEATAAAEALTERIDAVAGETKGLRGAIDDVAGTAGGLAGRIDALDLKLAALAKDDGGGNAGARAQALVLAVGHLDNVLRAGRAYDRALGTVSPLGQGDAKIEAALATLKTTAGSGVATAASLRARFAPLIAEALAADGRSNDEHWWDYVKHELFGLVTVRRRGEVAGEDTPSALARAEARLEQGDVAGALKAVVAIEGAPAKVLAAWRAEAAARVAAISALDGLRTRAIELLGTG